MSNSIYKYAANSIICILLLYLTQFISYQVNTIRGIVITVFVITHTNIYIRERWQMNVFRYVVFRIEQMYDWLHYDRGGWITKRWFCIACAGLGFWLVLFDPNIAGKITGVISLITSALTYMTLPEEYR